MQTPPGASGLCSSRLLAQRRGALGGDATSRTVCFTSHQIRPPGKRRHVVAAAVLLSAPLLGQHTPRDGLVVAAELESSGRNLNGILGSPGALQELARLQP